MTQPSARQLKLIFKVRTPSDRSGWTFFFYCIKERVVDKERACLPVIGRRWMYTSTCTYISAPPPSSVSSEHTRVQRQTHPEFSERFPRGFRLPHTQCVYIIGGHTLEPSTVEHCTFIVGAELDLLAFPVASEACYFFLSLFSLPYTLKPSTLLTTTHKCSALIPHIPSKV